jgi:PAS domain S-box-containing protein
MAARILEMTLGDETIQGQSPHAFGMLPVDTLASFLDQSADCVKLLDAEGKVRYMNPNGICAMEIDDFADVAGRNWIDLWPADMKAPILSAYEKAAAGETARFSAYCPTAKGTPRWWDVSLSPVNDPAGNLTAYLSVSRDVTEAELSRQALEIATAEMRHRLKNSYTVIGSLLSGFARGIPEREAFADEMIGRLQAMAAAQILFVAKDHAPCSMAELIPALVAPFSRPDCPVITDAVADVDIGQEKADAIALVFGELTVNSNKHGALSGIGSVHVGVTSDQGRMTVSWSERSDRAVQAHSREGGQGLRLIERIVRARGGELAMVWHPYGVDVTVTFRAI